MDARTHENGIFALQFVKPILQTVTHLIQSWNTIHGFRDLLLVCKMHECMILKNFEHLDSFPLSDANDYN